MRFEITEDFKEMVSGNATIFLSQRNLDMLIKYGAVHKSYPGHGGMEILVEPNEVHYSPEKEEVHKRFTDGYLYEGEPHPSGLEQNK